MGAQPKPITIHLNDVYTYSLPTVVDDESNPIFVSNQMPAYATYDTVGLYYTFSPTQKSDLGKGTVNGVLSDTQLTTNFGFTVTVVNDPPKFSSALSDHTVMV